MSYGLTGHRRTPTADKPLRDELLSIERLEERAKALAARFTVDPSPRRLSRSVFPRFRENARILNEAYRTLAQDVHQGAFVTPPGEWILDNFHLVTSELLDVRRNMPRGYYRQLPTLAPRELAGHARMYTLAVELIRHSDSRLDRHQLVRFLNSFQTVAPLTIGELWAWPSMLRLALIENLRRLAQEVLEARDARQAADAYVARFDTTGQAAGPDLASALPRPISCACSSACASTGLRLSPVRATVENHLAAQNLTSEDAIRSEHQRQAAAQVSVANVITSLRLCSTLDWSHHFEAVSLVERVLQRDPAGVYGSMDFLSRDRYRQAVEELADPTGEAQLRVGLRAVESARQAADAGSPADRAAHVGHHLIGKGRPDLETDVAYRPRLGRRVKRVIFAHATAAYLGAIGLLSALLIGVGVAYLRSLGTPPAGQVWVALLLLLPASELAIAFVQFMSARLAPPRRLPRLDWQGGVPERAQTMVVVPTLLTSVLQVEELLEHLEVVALGNLDARIHFAILSDFTDALARDMPGDEAILSAARDGDRGAQHPLRRRTRRSLLPLPPGPALERAGRDVDGMGAQAGQDRGVQPPVAWRHRHDLRRADRRRIDPPRHPLLHHPRYRHAVAARRGEEAHRHHQPSAQRPALRRRRGPRHRGVRDPAAAGQRDHGQCRRFALRSPVRGPHRR